MRPVAFAVLAALLAVSLGCTDTIRTFIRPKDTGGGINNSEPPTVAALCNYLNENAARLETVRCDDLALTVSQGPVLRITLPGKMVCQRPRNFRMSADAPLGSGREVDLGSNQEEFWWWIKKGDPYQFHCSYQALSEGKVRQVGIPFQPDWIMDALGMGTYGPPEKYQLKVEPDKLMLVEQSKSPSGAPVKKVIVFNRRESRGNQPQVTDFLLIDDATGKEIASAHISEVQVDSSPGGKGGTLPRKMELRWPEAKVRLALQLSAVAFNAQVPSEIAFRRLPMTDVPSYDLATGRVDAQQRSLQRVGGTK